MLESMFHTIISNNSFQHDTNTITHSRSISAIEMGHTVLKSYIEIHYYPKAIRMSYTDIVLTLELYTTHQRS